MESKIYKAHKNEKTGEIQSVKEHSVNTANLCREFAIPILKDMMYVVGMLHDVGKYQDDFQRRIDGESIKVEHSGCGALVAKEIYHDSAVGLLMQYCIAGHHSGIPDGGYKNDTADLATLHGRMKRQFEDFEKYKEELELIEIRVKEVIEFFVRDCDNNKELMIDKFAFWDNEAMRKLKIAWEHE